MAGSPPLDDDYASAFDVRGFESARYSRSSSSQSSPDLSESLTRSSSGSDGSITPSQIFDGVTKFIGQTLDVVKVAISRDKPEQPTPPKAQLPKVDDIEISVPTRKETASAPAETSLNDRVLLALARHDD